ncbi:2-keto-4-pentenoate hydratase/2-oxohepta-3-ene-1,7-dioic acid hydratase in catechol pathway [Actinocorallia herbida]|uniref:2-keto-4-pentenoate hydratase/2-oxohepta-3-ene-1,7-dioic acid hydratase in catechol pathway n=1 Tax=Actinocorallia herbida TaxID=58109 RepID=A0A3N1D3E8_9ACTN|nr:fumarylacetoacetate hydrolase family protein [Actinocorallia herbida]ROO88016.1 2-keto-4-pentenoate hydratase/2-oxohepta-3-ene-1,7-dioic acid hydratase in catechol pathway [Actinocorallia herbida]
MRYATFEVETPVGPVRRVGIVTSAGDLLDVNLAFAHTLAGRVDRSRARAIADALVPADLAVLLANGEAAREAVLRAADLTDAPLDALSAGGGRLIYRHEEVRLLAPLPSPPSLRDCAAFEQHVKNSTRGNVPAEWYEMPVYYKGNPRSVVGTGADVVVPRGAERLDYELEFAIVIGRAGRDVPPESAAAHIAGYTVFNDVSERRQQFKEMRGGLGPAKGKDRDGWNVLGPYLVTADAWDPAEPHTMVARVAGEVWSRGSTDSIHHSVAEIVSYLSRAEELRPGDVIGAGTVGWGSGLELGRYPQAGDLVELEIDGLGVLANRWVAA